MPTRLQQFRGTGDRFGIGRFERDVPLREPSQAMRRLGRVPARRLTGFPRDQRQANSGDIIRDFSVLHIGALAHQLGDRFTYRVSSNGPRS
jgi:hypothetical protein